MNMQPLETAFAKHPERVPPAVQRAVNKLPVSALFVLSHAPGLTVQTLRCIEERLGALMSVSAEADGQWPALARQVIAARAAGMRPTDISINLGLSFDDLARARKFPYGIFDCD